MPSINNVVLLGRLTKDVELKAAGNSVVVNNNLAVNENFKNKDGEYDTDFIEIVAYGPSAKYLANYAKKGAMVSVVGKIKTDSYEKNGMKIYTTKVRAEQVSIITGGKTKDGADSSANTDVVDEADEISVDSETAMFDD